MAALRGALNEFYPPGTDFEPGKTAHLSQMVHSGAYDRITRLIDSAKEAGCEIIGNQRDPERRRIGLTLVEFTSKDEASPLVNEELFGPILPIIAVEVGNGYTYECALRTHGTRTERGRRDRLRQCQTQPVGPLCLLQEACHF